MGSSLAALRLTAALGVCGIAAAVACDRGSAGRTTAEAPGSATVAAAQYNPAVTVYKNPT
jgi:hypothetical protein